VLRPAGTCNEAETDRSAGVREVGGRLFYAIPTNAVWWFSAVLAAVPLGIARHGGRSSGPVVYGSTAIELYIGGLWQADTQHLG
jgi:hypothetical protein